MDPAYWVITVILVLVNISLLVYILILRRKSSVSLNESRYNIVKKFLTHSKDFIYSIPLDYDLFLRNLVELLSKIFESEVVLVFERGKKNSWFVKTYSELKFPKAAHLVSILEIVEKDGINAIIKESDLDKLGISKHKHKICLPTSVDFIQSKDLKSVLSKLNIDTMVIFPIYIKNKLKDLFFIFTRNRNFSRDSEMFSNLLTDYLSIFIELSNYKEAISNLRNILSDITTFKEEEKITQVVVNRNFEVISWDKISEFMKPYVENNKLKEFFLEINVEHFIKEILELKSFSRVISSYLRDIDNIATFKIDSRHISPNRILIKISEIHTDRKSSLDLEYYLERISDSIGFPILIASSTTGEVIYQNPVWEAEFSFTSKGKRLDEIKKELKTLENNLIVGSSNIFKIENISLQDYELEGFLFVPHISVELKTAMTYYAETGVLRRFFSMVHLSQAKAISKNVKFYARYQSSDLMSFAGGDIFVVKDHGNKTFVGIFDVSGHSISTSFVALQIKHIIEQYILDKGIDLIEIYNVVNDFLLSVNSDVSDTYIYATGILSCIDKSKMEMSYISASHKYIVALQENGISCLVNQEDISKALGIIDKSKPPKIKIVPIKEKEKFFFYTDGLVELEFPNGEINEAKILDLIIFCRNMEIKETIEEIFAYIKSLNVAKVVDDFTILGVEI